MELQELNSLYKNKEQIGLTKGQLNELNNSKDINDLDKLRNYPKAMSFFIKIPKQALEMEVPESNLTPLGTKLKDCCSHIEIDNQIYAKISVYNSVGNRTLPAESSEFYTWIDNFGIDNVVKELPNIEI